MRDFQGIAGELLAKIRQRRFEDLEGATLHLTLPLREGLINQVIALGLADKKLPIRSVRVAFREGGRVLAEIDPDVILLPNLRVTVLMPAGVDLTRDPTLRLQLSADSRAATFFLESASFLKFLPEWMTIANRQIQLHLPTLLERQNLGDLMPHLRQLGFRSADGTLVLYLDAEIAAKNLT